MSQKALDLDNLPPLEEISDEALEQLVTDFLTGQASLAGYHGLTPDQLESIYCIGYNYFTAGNYREGQNVFNALSILQPFEFKYWMGLGGCRQRLEQFQEALQAYAMAMLLKATDPRSMLYAADCHMALNNHEQAGHCLQLALSIMDDSHADFRKRAKLLLATIEKQKGQKPAAK